MVQTEEQLGGSLSAAEKIDSKDMCILDVRLANHDESSALQRLTETLGKKSKKILYFMIIRVVFLR